MRRRSRRTLARRTAAGIELALPDWVTELVRSSLDELRRDLVLPGGPVGRRLLAQLDESAPSDDPVVTLMRQHTLDETLDAIEPTIGRQLLTDDEAEGWLEVLGLVLTARMAQLGVRTEVDRWALNRSDEAYLQVVYALQVALMHALDGPPASR